MDKRVFYSDEFLANLIYMRCGYIPRPDRYIVTKKVVALVIHKMVVGGNHVWDKDTDWLWFFRTYGHLYTATDTDIVSAGVVPFVRSSSRFKKKLMTASASTYAYYVLSYIQPYVYEQPTFNIGDMANINSNDVIFHIKHQLGDDGCCNKLISIAREFIADDLYPDKNDPAFPWFDYWKIGGAWFNYDHISEFKPIHIISYLGSVELYHSTIYDINAVKRAITALLNDTSSQDRAKIIDAVHRVCIANGNNIPLLTCVPNGNRRIYDIITHDNDNPVTDYGSIITAYDGGPVPDDIIDRFIKFGDITSMPVSSQHMLLTMPRMLTIITRTDGADQLKQLLLHNNRFERWLEANISAMPMVPVAMSHIIEACAEAMMASGMHTLPLYSANRVRRIIMDIIRSDIYTWIEVEPEIMRVCYLDPVILMQVHRSSTKVDRKRYYENVPLRSVTSTILTAAIVKYDTFIKFNLTRYANSDRHTKPMGIEDVFATLNEMIQFVVTTNKTAYLMDIDNIQMEITLAKRADPSYGDHRFWLTRLFDSILYKGNTIR